jgi:hypothetical protein
MEAPGNPADAGSIESGGGGKTVIIAFPAMFWHYRE